MADTHEIEVDEADVTLAGTVWLPIGVPETVILMHPGSGPEDRQNSGYFVPLRSALVDAGHAVAAFDKRGVGGSTGQWQSAPIETQASDLLAGAAAVTREFGLEGLPVGLFGHSQGGWVVIEAGSRDTSVDFLIMNSGPAVSPATQERFSARKRLEASGADPDEVEIGVARYDLMVRLARALTPYSDVAARKSDLSPHLPKDSALWRFWISILDYEPRSALSRIHIPILALYGSEDTVVPVSESIAVLEKVVPPTRLDAQVFEGGNHRVQVGEPPRLAPGYIEKVLHFLESHSQS